MLILKQHKKNISRFTGEFKDRSLEHDFQTYMLPESINYSRRYVLTFGIVFFLFILPDYFYVKNISQFPAIFLTRILFLLISVYYYIRVSNIKISLYFFSTIYEVIGLLFFWIVFSFYKEPNIIIHHQILIIFVLAIFFTIPNWFLNKLFLTIFLTIGFFYIAAKEGVFLTSACSWDLCILTIIILIFCSLIVKYINRLQRIQFLDNQTLSRLSVRDPLTGIYNRMKYDQDLKKEINRARRYSLYFSGIMLDLDNFKEINDIYGHLAGDDVLKKLSSTIKDIIRENDRLYRWGGEEFIILLPNTNLVDAKLMAERIYHNCQEIDFMPIKKVTSSFGVTGLKEDDNADTFTQRLDQLMYEAKMNGKNTIVSDRADNHSASMN